MKLILHIIMNCVFYENINNDLLVILQNEISSKQIPLLK